MVGMLVGFVVMLFGGGTQGEKLGAASGVLCGMIGAGGAALAVYLTLAAQRQDEAEKVEAALRMEVAEFGRLACGPLFICERIFAEQAEV